MENIYSNYEILKNVCLKYDLNYEDYVKNYDELPSFNHKQLLAFIDVLRLCIKEILSENLLKPNNYLFSSKIINFLHEKYASDIKIHDICKVFGITEKTLYKITAFRLI